MRTACAPHAACAPRVHYTRTTARAVLQQWLERADEQYEYDESLRAEMAAKEARLRDTAWLRAEDGGSGGRPTLEKRFEERRQPDANPSDGSGVAMNR